MHPKHGYWSKKKIFCQIIKSLVWKVFIQNLSVLFPPIFECVMNDKMIRTYLIISLVWHVKQRNVQNFRAFWRSAANSAVANIFMTQASLYVTVVLREKVEKLFMLIQIVAWFAVFYFNMNYVPTRQND